MSDSHRVLWPVVFVGGLLFGLGLAVSGMARPEVVLNFLQLEDLGLILVMGGAAGTVGIAFAMAPRVLDSAPITGDQFALRLKSFDRTVLMGGATFGVGWGLSGVCPGAAYASLGIGNVSILWAISGMVLGAYAQGYWRDAIHGNVTGPAAEVADD
jgi:uncharacterized membrane protein YedE/YeeE